MQANNVDTVLSWMGQPLATPRSPRLVEADPAPLTALHVERLDVGFSCEYCGRCREFSDDFPDQFRGHLTPQTWKQSIDDFNAVIRSSFLVSRPWILYLNMPLGFVGIALILFSSDADTGVASSMYLRYTGFSIFFVTGIMSLFITFGWMISVNQVALNLRGAALQATILTGVHWSVEMRQWTRNRRFFFLIVSTAPPALRPESFGTVTSPHRQHLPQILYLAVPREDDPAEGIPLIGTPAYPFRASAAAPSTPPPPWPAAADVHEPCVLTLHIPAAAPPFNADTPAGTPR